MTKPVVRLRGLCGRILPDRTMRRLVAPAIADLLAEQALAWRTGSKVRVRAGARDGYITMA